MKKGGKKGIWGLVVGLVMVLVGGVLFIGAVSGWFDDPKITLDSEYYGGGAEFTELSSEEYEDLVEAKKSFVVFVDQGGCTTADRLREYVTEYMKEKGILIYRMMFEEVKKSSLHSEVKYYPSVAIISKGIVKGYLRADADEDAEAYNNYDAFSDWIGKYL